MSEEGMLEEEMPEEGQPPVEPEQDIEALRADFCAAVKANKPRDFANVVRKAWHLLSHSDGHGTILPLFESAKTVVPLVEKLASAAFELERRALCGVGGLSSGGNMILHGVKGVGKTTLMKGFLGVLRALSTSLVLVFIDYQMSAFQRPLEVLRKTVEGQVAEAGGTESMQELLELVTHTGRAVVFFADEVQQLYEADAERDAPTCLAVADLLAVGKTNNCLGILAGSTSQLRSLVFRRYVDSAVDQYRHYPDLNNSVYPTQFVAPLRTPEELEGVLRQRAQRGGMDDAAINVVLDKKYISEVFSATGGVGRLLPLHLGDAPTKHNVDEFLRQFATQPAFRKVMSRLFCDNGGLQGDTPYPLWTPRGLAMTEVVAELVGLVKLAEVWALHHAWVDDALAFSDGANIQMFSACHFEALREFLFEPADPGPLLRLSLEGTLGGWGAGSPGARIEKYLQERYALSEGVRFEQRKLTFAAGVKKDERVFRLRVSDVAAEGDAGGGAKAGAGGADAASGGADDTGGGADNADMLSFAELSGVLFDVLSDQGLDGFIVTRVDADTVYLHVLQIKTGLKGKQITRGGPASDRKPDDKTMRGIIAKAARGAKAFRNSVTGVHEQAHKKAPTLVFESFTLITTKTLNKEATETYVDKVFEQKFGADAVPVFITAGADCFDLMDATVRRVVDPL